MVSEGSEDNTLFIGTDHDCSFNVVEPEGRPAPTEEALNERDGVHAGGAATALQFDGQNFHDLLISDVTYPTGERTCWKTPPMAKTAPLGSIWPSQFVPHTGEADSISSNGSPPRIRLTPTTMGIGTWLFPEHRAGNR